MPNNIPRVTDTTNYSTLINPEYRLKKPNKNCIQRFQYLESKESGSSCQNMTLAEMEVYWNEAKKL
jgi:XTP/dITP diphosphohydrolase